MIRFEQIEMPAANLGQENPLPDMSRKRYVAFNVKATERVSEEEAKERVEEIYPVPYNLDFRMS